MHDSSICFLILKMQEPMFSILRINPCALVRTIDSSAALIHHHASFVRTKHIFGTKHCLPSRANTTRRSEDVVMSISLVEFRTLDGWIDTMTIINDHRIPDYFSTLAIHFPYYYHRFDSCTTSRKRVYEIGLPIIVQERAWVDKSLPFENQSWFRPWTCDLFRGHEI